MLSINLDSPFIELEVDREVIKSFELQDIVENCYKINHPETTRIIDNFDEPGKILFPFTFPPYYIKHTREYLNEFILIFNDVFKDIDERHHDNILFLAYTYIKVYQNRRNKIIQEDVLRKRGKLLLELIEVPIPILNKKNIFDAFNDEPYLEQEEIKENILTYLVAATNRHSKEFLVNPNDTSSNIDFKKVDDNLWLELTRRIQRDRNISILMEERATESANITEKRYLTVSRDIKLKFQTVSSPKKTKEIFKDADFQNSHLLVTIIKELFEEQKKHKTDFYYALLKHDFIINQDIQILKSTTGLYNRSSQHYFSLEALRDSVLRYLEIHNLLTNNLPTLQKQIRDDFILRYFLLLNLSSAPDVKNLSSFKSNIKDIQKALEEHKAQKRKNPIYATMFLTDISKNNKRPERFKPDLGSKNNCFSSKV